MKKRLLTRKDRILHAVLSEPILREKWEYDETEYSDISTALTSDVFIVKAVAMIIDAVKPGYSETSLYNEVRNFLNVNV